MTTFIKFSLQDKNGQAILGIDDGALQQNLLLEINNPDPYKNISIKPLKENSGYHFCLNFRPGTLLQSNLDKVTLSQKNHQEKWELTKKKDSFSFSYKGEKDIILEPGAKNSLILTLENISAEPGGGARGTRVELDYKNLSYTVDDKNQISGTLLQYLNVVNQRGNQQIPLYVGFIGSDKTESEQKINVGNKPSEEGTTQTQTIKISNLRVVGSNRILNDGTPNELILTFCHLEKNPFQKKENEVGLSLRGTDKHSDAATNFKISFDVLPKETSQNLKTVGLDIKQLTKNIVEQADNLLKGQDNSKPLQELIELILKKMEDAQTTKWQNIQQAELDTLPLAIEPVELQNAQSATVSQETEAEILRQNKKISEQGSQQASTAILNLKELPPPVQKIADVIQQITEASLELDKLCKKLTDSSQEKQSVLTDIKETANFIQYKLVKLIFHWTKKLREETREALLCATDASKVEIHLSEVDAGDWHIESNFQGASPQWTVTRRSTAPQLKGEILRLKINKIITRLPAGYGNLYVYYENIPGYWDGYIICPIEKGPLMFRKDGQGEESLGIGTDTPEAKLHVVQKGLTNVAVFEGESGVAIKGAKGNHNALWITDTETDFPALYVEQKGKGEAAYFGGEVFVENVLKVGLLPLKRIISYFNDLRTKNEGWISLDKISKDLNLDISVWNGVGFTKNQNIKICFSKEHIYISDKNLIAELKSNIDTLKLDEANRVQIINVQNMGKLNLKLLIDFSKISDWGIHNFFQTFLHLRRSSERFKILFNKGDFLNLIFYSYSYENFTLTKNRLVSYQDNIEQHPNYQNWSKQVELPKLAIFFNKLYQQKDRQLLISSVNEQEQELLIQLSTALFEYFLYEKLTEESRTFELQEFLKAQNLKRDADKENNLPDFSLELLDVFFNEIRLAHNGKLLFKKYRKGESSFYLLQLFDENLAKGMRFQSSNNNEYEKTCTHVSKWEEFTVNPYKFISFEKSSLDLSIGRNGTGLHYDNTNKSLTVYNNFQNVVQIDEQGNLISPNKNLSIQNCNVEIGTSEFRARLNIDGILNIGGRTGDSREHNKIVIGKREVIQIGEWEKTDVLSIKAESISLDVNKITAKPGGKLGIKNCQNNQYISCDGGFSWRNNLDTYENFTLEMSCSRELKENIVSLTAEEATSTIAQLNAVKYDYKGEPAFRPNLGFIAEEMPDNLASADRKTLSPFEVIPVLTKVVQDQQQKIESLQLEVSELQQKLNQSEDLS